MIFIRFLSPSVGELEGKNLATSDIEQQDPFNTDFHLAHSDPAVDPPKFIDCKDY